MSGIKITSDDLGMIFPNTSMDWMSTMTSYPEEKEKEILRQPGSEGKHTFEL